MKLSIRFVALLVCSFSLAQDYTGKYDEQWRPQFHFTPPSNWMNDPNGLVFFNGKYHLFYQYHPHSNVWGPMHWGHAESVDLMHWTHLPIALYPDEKGHVFSGSAVIDKDNTAGFGDDAMVAIYTYHSDELWKKGHKNTESQAIAYSLDEGRTWTKYKHNPVLNNTGEQDFRDPKVFWHDQSKKWKMVLAVHDMIRIFSSADLKQWTFESNFKPIESTVLGVWECPDLFPLNHEGEEKWVMIVNHGDKAVNGGSGTRYFVGDFDGKTFKAQTAGKWLDYGTDYYAAVTYNMPSRSNFIQGWMSNWLYATKVPTEVWRSAMALPRELTLSKDKNGWFLRQEIVPQFSRLRDEFFTSEWAALPLKEQLPPQAEVVFEFTNGATDFVIELSNDAGDIYRMELNGSQFTTDRSRSGKVDFSDKFVALQSMPVGRKVSGVQIIVDNSSVEILLDEGRYVMTNIVFPSKSYDSVTIKSGSAKEVRHFDINAIKSTWK